MDALRQHIVDRLGHEPANLDRVLSNFEEVTYKRGTMLLSQGEVCRYVYFIVKGCVQVYVIDKNGNESTREFYIEQQWVTDIFGFQNQKPSSEFIKCIEPSELIRIHFDSFQILAKEVPPFINLYKKILEVS